MKTASTIPFLIPLVALLISSCQSKSSQEPNLVESTRVKTDSASQTITIAGVTYALYDSVWFTVVDGRKGDRVILAKLIVRPDSGVAMETFDYQSIGVPNLKIIGVTTGAYYILDMSELSDPFDVARKLWDSGKFTFLEFDFLVPVTGTS